MSKYHAGKNGFALCGSGSHYGFKTTIVDVKTWNQSKPEYRCVKCVAAIKARSIVRQGELKAA